MGIAIVLGVLLTAVQEEEDRFLRRGVRWDPNLAQLIASKGMPSERGEEEGRFFRRGGEPKKYILIYVRPVQERREPNLFSDATLGRMSREEWAFSKMDFDPADPRLKKWGVRRAPMLVGVDIHGNDFLKTTTVSLPAAKSVTRALPEAISRYHAKLRAEFAKAKKLLGSNEGRGIAALRDLVAGEKAGYAEIGEARGLLDGHADESWRTAELAESVSDDEGIAYLEGLAKLYRGTLHGDRAEIRIAELERRRGNGKAAELRLKKVLKANGPGADEARILLLKLPR